MSNFPGDTLPQPQLSASSWTPLLTLHVGESSSVIAARLLRTGRIVAVKLARISGSDVLERWKREVQLTWSCRDSPFICSSVAHCAVPQARALVLEWAPYGSLAAILHDDDEPSSSSRFGGLDDGFGAQRAALGAALGSGDDALRLGWACDVARGVAYLHDVAGYAHRDIKPANVVVGRDLRAQLTDLECAKPLATIDGVQKWSAKTEYRGPARGAMFGKMVGTLPYLAPEVLMREALHASTDTYALAVTLNEIATRSRPYADGRTASVKFHTMVSQDYSDMELIRGVFAEGVRPTTLEQEQEQHDDDDARSPSRLLLQAAADTAVWRAITSLVIEEGWQLDARARPKPGEVARRLCALVDEAGVDVSIAARAAAAAVPAPLPTPTPAASTSSAAPPTPPAAPTSIAALTRAVDWEALLPRASPPPPARAGVRGKGEATAGRRGAKAMEDRMVALHALELRGGAAGDAEALRPLHAAEHLAAPGRVHLFAVFDGHGGAAAAHLAAEGLHREMLLALAAEQQQQQQREHEGGPLASVAEGSGVCGVAQRALTRVFAALDAEIVASGCGGGTTALVALIIDATVFIANAGDCRAVLRRGSSTVALSRDHVASDATERARVESCGAVVAPTADGRLRVDGLCEVTRALGDADLKQHGVVATPTVTTTFTHDSTFLILACDGVWDVLSGMQACAFVADTVRHVDFGAKRLVMEAFNAGSTDNLSAIVIYLFW